jgi:hypothetical protein
LNCHQCRSHHNFYDHYHCPVCSTVQPLPSSSPLWLSQ